jgi:hypothetical protein
MRYTVIVVILVTVSWVYSYLRKPVPPLAPATNVINVSSVQQLAVAVNSVQSGQTILLADGEYVVPPRELIISRSNVTIRGASGDPSKVFLKGYGFHSSTDVDEEWFKLVTSDITLADFKIGESRCHAVKFQNTCNNILIHNVHFYNVGERGLKVPRYSGHRNVEIRYCIFENDQIPDPNRVGAHGGGNYIGGMDIMQVDGWHIHDNLFVNIKGASGDARGAIFAWQDSKNITAERNVFIGCDRAFAWWGTVSNSIIRNNFIVPGVNCGMDIRNSNGIKVYNNTSFSSIASQVGTFRFDASTNCEVKNNIIQSGVAVTTGNTPDTSNNITLLRAQLRTAAACFVNELEGDLHLKCDTLGVVDGGIVLSDITDDWDGKTRTGNPDIGADEYDGDISIITGLGNNRGNKRLTVWPNPFCTSVDIRLNSSTVPQFHSSTVNPEIKIFDINGRLVSNLANYGTVELQHSGTTYRWHPQDQPNGVYTVILRAGEQKTESARIILAR